MQEEFSDFEKKIINKFKGIEDKIEVTSTLDLDKSRMKKNYFSLLCQKLIISVEEAKMKKLVIPGAVVCCLITFGITFSIIANVQKQSNIDGNQKTFSSWVSYENEAEMIGKTELIVVGKVLATNNRGKAKIELMLNENLSPEQKKEMSKDFKGYNPVTISDILIENVLKGDAKIGQTIQAQQLGGLDGDTKFVVDDIQYLEKGQTYLLYLNKAELDGDNKYFVQNPFDSVIKIEGKKAIKRPETKMFKNIDSIDKIIEIVKVTLDKN